MDILRGLDIPLSHALKRPQEDAWDDDFALSANSRQCGTLASPCALTSSITGFPERRLRSDRCRGAMPQDFSYSSVLLAPRLTSGLRSCLTFFAETSSWCSTTRE